MSLGAKMPRPSAPRDPGWGRMGSGDTSPNMSSRPNSRPAIQHKEATDWRRRGTWFAVLVGMAAIVEAVSYANDLPAFHSLTHRPSAYYHNDVRKDSPVCVDSVHPPTPVPDAQGNIASTPKDAKLVQHDYYKICALPKSASMPAGVKIELEHNDEQVLSRVGQNSMYYYSTLIPWTPGQLMGFETPEECAKDYDNLHKAIVAHRSVVATTALTSKDINNDTKFIYWSNEADISDGNKITSYSLKVINCDTYAGKAMK